MAENILHQIIYSIIQKYDTSGIVGDRSRNGRPKKLSTGQRRRLKRLVNHQTRVSLRKIAQRFNVHRRAIQRELKDMSVYCRKEKRAPRWTEKQTEVPKRARGLYRTLLEDDYE